MGMRAGIFLPMFGCMVLLGVVASAVRGSAQQMVIPVWSGVAPGSESWTQKEVEYLNGRQKMIRNVVLPTLTAYLPERAKATGTAVVICPGGGFHFLSWDSEGIEVAKWLQARGVAAFVLKYRLLNTGATEAEFQRHLDFLFGRKSTTPDGKETIPTPQEEAERKAVPDLAAADGRQAIRVVRQRAVEWGVAPDRIGILGFSAGGAVTMGVVMQHAADSRPNFATLCEALPADCHILVTADHGGHDQTHGTNREDDITTPLLLSGPSIPANHTIKRSVRITDIAPTIAQLFGLTPPDAWIGSPITFPAP